MIETKKTIEQAIADTNLICEDVRNMPHPGESDLHFKDRVFRDYVYIDVTRNYLISPERGIKQRAFNTLISMHNHPDNYFKNILFQVYLKDEKGEEHLIASLPHQDKKLEGSDTTTFPLNSLSYLVIKPFPIDLYQMHLLEKYSKNLALHIENAWDYELNQKSASEDELTGLYNRRFFDSILKQSFAIESEKPADGLVLILADLDNLKPVNDKHPKGHIAGDRLLRGFASVAQSTFGKNRDTIARVGGDEFAILMPYTTLKQGVKRANVFKDNMERKIFNIGIEYYTDEEKEQHIEIPPVNSTICLGVAHSDSASTPEELYLNADNNLIKAKQTGKNKVHY
ncbi:MAG: GGDEF domain-containing protein [Candidatus Nanoarchaeia archaeon]|nr:GGDEF domain-containing protein [Candidatus Nanoarchaeia archaeon]MDD5588240.1 GGDEF domain-containing protein [Candidatus Nanoarchaeia archaeon]